MYTEQNKILIVEDERIVAMDIAATLRSLGYQIAGLAASSDEAIQYTIENKPDLILMDIRIKGDTDGIQTAEKILDKFDIPIIYLTAYADENTLQRAKLTEPYGYLLKPYEKRVLHSTIEMALYKKIIEGKLKENERWLSAILRNIGEGIIATDENYKIKFMNPLAEEMLCYSQNDLFGKNVHEYLIILDENKNEIINYIEEKESSHTGVLISKKGDEIPVLFSSTPIKSEHEDYFGYVIIFRDIRKQKDVEAEREKLFNQVNKTKESLKILSRRLIDVQETEKRYIARELHDEIGQIITAIKINLQTCLRFTPTDEGKIHLSDSINLVDEVLNKTRNLSLNLRPSMLDDLGLIPALRWYIDKQTQKTDIKAVFDDNGIGNLRFESEIETTCFRITQEAINNILKHSGAKNIIVNLSLSEEELFLEIKDDGIGFNVFVALKNALKGGSVGLLGMQERVELVGGKLTINSDEKKGTTLFGVFPALLK